ncbi:bifunctional GNAT family N-acetyltransferase/(deoxy)nucleoside triphosphate pyrophosphohydrolase [Magnetospirillum sp. UT-4]|uniref:bifunctional GNAT family N-acetyltransferase/(deoxy)nucleoside triphosphate pyrophosphohydrolase n=1 Tax=Magnetospirillum sp. UT-4 TaxID=2681467 RepID=UPI001384464F|nr:GNAT family N-acetyltransferase [Magnetospirillum sp. UT-4]CAA7620073.1 NTP pyrophosphohydrolase [Magnetospirillum sp. UT-4]
MSDEDQGCWAVGTVWNQRPLLTARLRLRPFHDGDIPRLVAVLDDWEMVRHTPRIPHPYGEDDARAFLALDAERRRTRRGAALAVERAIDGMLVGAVGFVLDDRDMPEVGYWVSRADWGQGIAAEALLRLLRHLFADLKVERVWASAHPDNAPSCAVMAKAGMVLDGHLTVAMPARGESVYAPRYAVTREEWNRRHATRPMVVVAAAALIDADGRVLLASRPSGKTMAGLWEFPGGKVRPGETPEAALVRELAEELGIDVGESCLAPLAFASHDYDGFHLLMPLYAIRQWKGNPHPREGQELKWVRAADLGALPMPPADIPLVPLLRQWI